MSVGRRCRARRCSRWKAGSPRSSATTTSPSSRACSYGRAFSDRASSGKRPVASFPFRVSRRTPARPPSASIRKPSSLGSNHHPGLENGSSRLRASISFTAAASIRRRRGGAAASRDRSDPASASSASRTGVPGSQPSSSRASCSTVRPEKIDASGIRSSICSVPPPRRSRMSSHSLPVSPFRSFTSVQTPRSLCPRSSNRSLPLSSPSAGSSSGTQRPWSHTITSPAPYSPSGITPSKSAYSSGWSSTWTASRFSAGSVEMPFGTAQDLSTPSISRRRS